MIELIDQTRRAGNTLGGVVEVVAHHVPRVWAATCTGTVGWTRAWRAH
jgi:chorismate synthase